MKSPPPSKNQASQRQLRVGEEIRHALAEVMLDISFLDTRLAGVSVTVSQVQAAPDLRYANVYVIPLGLSGEEAEKVVRALNDHAKHLRHEVDRRVRLKFSAALKFIYDTSLDTAARLEELLKS